MRARIWLPMILLAALTGCFGPFTRFQSAEETEREKDLDVRKVADVTEVANGGVLQLSGVGLVTDLAGTGDVPQGAMRTMLENQLQKQRVENIKALLDSPNNALVMVSALVPPGHRKGEPLDVEVTLPPNSRAKSLRGGYLQNCPLRNYESKHNINPTAANEILAGHVLGRAHGPLLVGLGDPDAAAENRRGRIWEGAVFLADRPFYLVMKKDEKSIRFAHAVAERLNHLFREDPHKVQEQFQRLQLLDNVTQQLNQKFDASVSRGEVAKAMNKEIVTLNVPYAYRLNPERYLRVARLVPLTESFEQRPKYRQRLQKMILDPQETVRAALRLEALGQESLPALKKGLESEHPLVRFTAAEALTYLGSTEGVGPLAELAQRHEQLRFWSLLALANLDESITRSKLTELLHYPDAQVRCGAFVAFRMLDRADPRTRDERLGAELLGDAFWLHQVAPRSTPMVFMSLSKRAEIVLFGSDIQLTPPVQILAGPEFTITAQRFDKSCTVTRIDAKGSTRQSQSPLQLDDVLRTMADLGAQYPDAVEFLRKADQRKCLSCPLRINTLPEPVPVDVLAEAGRDSKFPRSED